MPEMACSNYWRRSVNGLRVSVGLKVTIAQRVCIVKGSDCFFGAGDAVFLLFRHGSNERDSSSSTERSGPVILSEAKHLAADRERPFASLRVTWYDCSNCQVRFVQFEPCLSKSNHSFHQHSHTTSRCVKPRSCKLRV